MRATRCELGALSRPDGSALFAQGETVTIAGVYGPVECKIQSSDPSKATIEVRFVGRSGCGSVRERQLEAVVRRACESALFVGDHPRDAISIDVRELDDAGGVLATCLNASCAALIDSGLPMRFPFAAVSCAVDADGRITVDPTLEQLEAARAEFTFAFDGRDGNVITSSTEGSFEPDEYHRAALQCKQASERVFSCYRNLIGNYANALRAPR